MASDRSRKRASPSTPARRAGRRDAVRPLDTPGELGDLRCEEQRAADQGIWAVGAVGTAAAVGTGGRIGGHEVTVDDWTTDTDENRRIRAATRRRLAHGRDYVVLVAAEDLAELEATNELRSDPSAMEPLSR